VDCTSEEGTVSNLDFFKEYSLSNELDIREKLYLKLIQDPFIFQVQGLCESLGSFSVSAKDLIFPPELDPYEDRPFLGPFVTGWYPVLPADPEQVDGFPTNVEFRVAMDLSETICSEEELGNTNVITITIEELHRLPQTWMPDENDDGEEGIYAHVVKYHLPGVMDMHLIETPPGKMIPPDPEESDQDGGPPRSPVPASPEFFEVQHTGRRTTLRTEQG